jgi:4-amino-4-deoxy-L-arabinose transferase-like glycosyltransferase
MVLLETYYFPTTKSMGAEMGWIGHSLAEGEGFKLGERDTAWMAPLYPYIIAFIFRIFGSYSLYSGLALIFLQSLISSLVSLPLYFVGKHLFNRNVGFLSALLWMIHPGPILYSINYIWSSTLTALGIMLTILLLYWFSDKPITKSLSIICGLTIGIMTLNDPVVLSILLVGVIWLIWYLKNDRKLAFITTCVITITATMVITPWLLRNYFTFEQFVPIKDTFGMNFWQGNCCPDLNQPTAGLSADDRLADLYTDEDLALLSSLRETERHQILMNRALEFVIYNPDIFINYTFQRIYLFWRHTPLTKGTLFDKMLAGIIPLVGIGIIMSWKNWRKTLLPVMIFVLYPLPYYFSISDTYRYRFPIEGLMYIFVAYALHQFFIVTFRIRSKQLIRIKGSL